MQDRAITFQRFGASSGLISPIIGFTCILISILTCSSFSWTENALSDLGVVAGITATLFNLGLLASGLLAFNFAVFALYTFLSKSLIGKIGSICFATGALALIAIGMFNENYSPTHYLVSIAFFVLMPIALFILTCSFWLIDQRKLGLLTLLAGFAGALPWILEFAFDYVPNVAIPEFISGLAISIWTFAVSVYILKKDRQ